MLRLIVIFAAACFFCPSQVNAATAPFAGVWQIKWCDKDPSRECGRFELYLVQEGSRICGDHFYNTLGLGRMNEGGSRSVIGTVSGSTATITITSGRDGSVFRARAKRDGRKLDWQLLEPIAGGENGEYMIYEKASLVKINDRYAVLKRVGTECSMH